MLVDIRFTFISDKDNVVVVKKSSDSDAFKFKQFASFKRVTLEIESRNRINKLATRSRFISIRSSRNISRNVRSRVSSLSSRDHLEDQIENDENDFNVMYDDLIDFDDDDDNAFDDDESQTRRSRSRARFSENENLEQQKKNLRRKIFLQRKIQTYRKKLSEFTFAQRTLFSLLSFSHFLSSYVVVALTAQSIETRTSFLHMTHESKYFKVKRTFVSVSFRLLQNVYHDRLNVRNLSKFIFSWATFDVVVDTRSNFFKNVLSLLMIMKMYCNVVLDFIHSNIRHQLDFVMSAYRTRIMKVYSYKTWSSIVTWHEKNLIRIIRIDQDVLVNWLIRYDFIEWKLKNIVVAESSKKTSDYQSSFTSRELKNKSRITTRNDACVAFNNNTRCDENCKYKHVCIKCQQKNHDKFECFNKIFKWLIDSFFFFSVSFFLSSFYSRQMIMSISIEWSFESLLYDVAFENASDLEIKMSLKTKKWNLRLRNYSDRNFVIKLLDIIKRDANIEYIENKKFRIFNNHNSINEIFDILIVDLVKQMTAHRLSRVRDVLSSHYVCSSLSLISKHDDDWRRIHDLSYFRDDSINESIILNAKTLKYVTIDEIIAVLIFQERDAVMLKKNLANAFRHIFVIILNRWLLDFCWNDEFYMKLFLSFDLRTVLFLFDLFAKTLHWILVVICHFRIVLHYLDDFLIIMKSHIDLESFKIIWRNICDVLDFETNAKKKKFDTKLEFLDIELDSEIMKARLSSVKLARTLNAVNVTLIADSLTYRQIDFLVNFLFFCAKVVISKRFFLIFLYLTRNHTRSVNRACKLNDIMRVDLRWWQKFLSQWNDVRVLRAIVSRSSSHIWTNASNNWNIDDFWLRASDDESLEDFNWRYSTRYRNRHSNIQIKKMRTMLHVLRQWLSRFKSNKMIIHCDNQTVCFELVKNTMRDSAMIFFRDVIMLFALHDILIEMKWLDSKFNHLADLLSRDEHDRIADEYSQLQIFHDQL